MSNKVPEHVTELTSEDKCSIIKRNSSQLFYFMKANRFNALLEVIVIIIKIPTLIIRAKEKILDV